MLTHLFHHRGRKQQTDRHRIENNSSRKYEQPNNNKMPKKTVKTV